MAGLPSVYARAWLGWCLAELGDFPEGIAQGEEAVAIAEAADHDYSRVLAAWGLGTLHVVRGDPERAIPVLERALVVIRMADALLLFPFVATPLGAAYALAGRVDDALPLLEDGLRQAGAMNLQAHHPLRLVWLGEALILAGQLERAAELATQARALAEEHGERGSLAYVWRLTGEVAARREPPDDRAAANAYASGASPRDRARDAAARGAVSPGPRDHAREDRRPGGSPGRAERRRRDAPQPADDPLARSARDAPRVVTTRPRGGTGRVLPRRFYERPAPRVARGLLGCILVSRLGGALTAGRIVETEAYLGPEDGASHAAFRPSSRWLFYGPGGVAYVFQAYGLHACLNAIAAPTGAPGCVLIRALEPLAGLSLMARRRGLPSCAPPIRREHSAR